jgi:multidrug resistance efflux pump
MLPETQASALSMLQAPDATTLWQRLLGDAIATVDGNGGSFWVPDDGGLRCLMVGGADPVGRQSSRIANADIALLHADSEESLTLAADLRDAHKQRAGVIRVCRDRSDGPIEESTQEAFAALVATANAVFVLLEKQQDALARSRDFALVAEMSREVTATLDLDRVLRAVVNLAARAITFDRGALALYEDGECDIRAVAGADSFDANDSRLKDLAMRAAWAAGRGEGLYVSDREDPASDAERVFLQFFSGDLEADNTRSGLYIPLRDEEGIVGVLVLECQRAEFATEHQREVIAILANQATVAIRNARLYSQVPLVDVLGAIGERRRAFRAIPRRRKQLAAVALLTALALLTLVRWPLRVDATTPVLFPADRAVVRPLVDGAIEQVFVAEGAFVEQGTALLRLRSVERQGTRNAAAASVAASERDASLAASRGDPAAERVARVRLETAREALMIADAELASTTVRAPVSGVVLTERVELLVGTHATAGSAVLLLGRTDSLEVEFTVPQRDVARIASDQRVRLRVDALPQRTFEGRIIAVAAMPGAALSEIAGTTPDATIARNVELTTATTAGAQFPVRALVANPDGLLRPGMQPFARVLTGPASLAERLFRRPIQSLRLFYWRMTA